MKIKYITTILFILTVFPLSAQIFNFSLRTNNQQLIDKTLEGAFVKINQYYELCDSVKDEHFGRYEKDYFSIIPFIGIETERGLIFPSATMTPWICDNDFNEYREQYKPLVTDSKLSLLNSYDKVVRSLDTIIAGDKISDRFSILHDTNQAVSGLSVDTLAGSKEGWFVWLTSESSIVESDSVKFSSIKKDIIVPTDGESLCIDKPEISGTVYGGIYVTPLQTGIGHLVLTLTGVMVLDEDKWIIEFPFIKAPKQNIVLTPIESISSKGIKRRKNETEK